MIITCPKCGQALMNEDNRALTDAEAAELALQTCKCPAARAWRSKEKQIDEACYNIESLCVANARELGMTEIENDEIIDILKKNCSLDCRCKSL